MLLFLKKHPLNWGLTMHNFCKINLKKNLFQFNVDKFLLVHALILNVRSTHGRQIENNSFSGDIPRALLTGKVIFK